MDDTINNFLLNQSIATICCTDEESNPYCFPCFYVYNSNLQLIYFKSSPSSYHSALLSNKPEIAGTILPDKLNILALKGVQFEGAVLPLDHPLMHNSSRHYYQKYPLAFIIPGEVYAIQLSAIKMTDGAKGFGKKITWRRKEAV
jgi:uncharacterized protein YhbP (UPF0306 family)